MTESEAIKILKKDSCYECAQGTDSPFNCEYGECRVSKATRVAIKALEEVQQYRAIGTPEEYRAAVEKQKTRKISSAWCPCCGKYLTSQKLEDVYYCVYCGQKLDWSDEKR